MVWVLLEIHHQLRYYLAQSLITLVQVLLQEVLDLLLECQFDPGVVLEVLEGSNLLLLEVPGLPSLESTLTLLTLEASINTVPLCTLDLFYP